MKVEAFQATTWLLNTETAALPSVAHAPLAAPRGVNQNILISDRFLLSRDRLKVATVTMERKSALQEGGLLIEGAEMLFGWFVATFRRLKHQHAAQSRMLAKRGLMRPLTGANAFD